MENIIFVFLCTISNSLEAPSNACNCFISATDQRICDMANGGPNTAKPNTFLPLSDYHWSRGVEWVLVMIDGVVLGEQILGTRKRLHHHQGNRHNKNLEKKSFTFDQTYYYN